MGRTREMNFHNVFKKSLQYTVLKRKKKGKENNPKKTCVFYKTEYNFYTKRILFLNKMYLKPLISSKTRVKLLNLFFSQPKQEFFVRELTRVLGEQINSIRRELESLQEWGLLTSRLKDGKKYFSLDISFFLYPELKRIFEKSESPALSIAKNLKKIGKVDILIVSGVFVGAPDSPVDIFIVGNIDKEKLSEYISQELKGDEEIRFALLTKSDFLYRLKCKDKILVKLLAQEKNIVPINKMPTAFNPDSLTFSV